MNIEHKVVIIGCGIVGSNGIENYIPLRLNIDEHDSLIESAEVLRKNLREFGF